MPLDDKKWRKPLINAAELAWLQKEQDKREARIFHEEMERLRVELFEPEDEITAEDFEV